MSSDAFLTYSYSGRLVYGAGLPQTLRFTSPQAPRVEPIALMTLLKTVLRSPLSTPWSWYVWRVVRRSVPFPYCASATGRGEGVAAGKGRRAERERTLRGAQAAAGARGRRRFFCAAVRPHLVSEVVHHLVELVGDAPGGLAGAHHEHVLLAAAEGALLAVVLVEGGGGGGVQAEELDRGRAKWQAARGARQGDPAADLHVRAVELHELRFEGWVGRRERGASRQKQSA